jgi:hypothetical protein
MAVDDFEWKTMDLFKVLLEIIMKKNHLIAYYIGIAIVFITHFFMLYQPNMKMHAFINLIAASLIAYYFMDKEFFNEDKKDDKYK